MTKLEELKRQKEKLEEEIEKLERNMTVTDPIYLLSVEEFEKYEGRIPEWSPWWWSRTPGYRQERIAVVYGANNIDFDGDVINNDEGSVRPVLNEANMSEEDRAHIIVVGDKDEYRMIFCGVTWVALGDRLWIAETSIAIRPFDEESTEYGKSEIRQFLLDWYESRRKW